MLDENGVISYLEAGLKASQLRGTVIANNIANLTTPGYRRREVDFEKLLAEAMQGTSTSPSEIEPQVFQPKNTPVKGNGNDVVPEAEIGKMVQNSAMYKTYMRLMARRYRQMEMAMSSNR